MNDQDIDTLVDAITRGKGKVYWMPDDDTMLKVIGIGHHPEEDGKCVYFPSGKITVLSNCELTEFVRIERLA